MQKNVQKTDAILECEDMAYKCSVCGTNDVANPGDVCELCAIGQDPYATAMQGGYPTGGTTQGMFQKSAPINVQNDTDTYVPGRGGRSRKVLLGGGAPVANTDPYGNSIVPASEDDSVQVYQAGQVPVNTASSKPQALVGSNASNATQSDNQAGPLCSGITKNISVDTQKKSALLRLFRTLFQGIPFTLDNDITMFQVFPDYTGTALNSMGYACDQVIVYGKLNAGAVAENNDVEVYGHRDSSNTIVAKKIVNKASGTTVKPDRVIPVPVVWAITILVFALMAWFIASYGVVGIVWAVILVLCLTNLPLVFKIALGIFGVVFSIFGSILRSFFKS